LLPTLISDDFDVIERGIAAVRDAIAIGTPGVLGIHIEGPFLNIEKKGIHDASKIRKMAERAVNLLSSRSEDGRVGKECVSTVRSRWSTYINKKKKNKIKK